MELKRVSRSVFAFSNHIYVVNPVMGKVRFDLYPYQIAVLHHFLTRRFNIILKFRQAGLTELIAMFCLWFALYHTNKNILLLSIKDRVAKKVLRRIKYMYRNLPDYLKVPIVNGRTGELGTSTEMVFSNGSSITSLPTSEDVGRSEPASLFVIDEAAIVRWIDKIWAALFPTISTGGSAIVNSTPFGIGGWYHKMWVDAMNKNAAGMGVNDTFNPIRLYWKMHPDRWDPARDVALGKDPYWWYNMMATNLGPRRLAQEVDGDFLSSGYSVFDLTEIKEIEECLSDYPVIETHINGSLRVFEKPKKDYQYYLGADVATGRAGDSSAFTLGDRYGDEAVIFKGKIPPNKFAELIGDWGMKYNRAIVAPESNDIGLAVTNKLQDMGYPNIYLTRAILKEHKKRKPKVEKLPGWYTTSKNRPVIIDGLEQDIRNNNIIVKDPYFVTEAYTFIYDESNRPVAMNKNRKSSDEGEDDTKYDDDAIMGKAIYNHIRKGQQKSPVVLPR